jgi:hypothetical protein
MNPEFQDNKPISRDFSLPGLDWPGNLHPFFAMPLIKKVFLGIINFLFLGLEVPAIITFVKNKLLFLIPWLAGECCERAWTYFYTI